MKRNQTGIQMKNEYFGELFPYIQDKEITDIDFNGTDVWVKDIYNNCKKLDIELSDIFIEQFSNRIANIVSKPFNQGNPVLEAETETLRISIGHESIARTGRTICIRKSYPEIRFTAKEAVETGYCSAELLHFLVNCVHAGFRFVVCGEVGAGKTECCKFLSQYIPQSRRILTIEDNLEWHYGQINPGANHVELKVNHDFDYSDAITFALRQDASGIMLSEARGKEAKELIVAWSTGAMGFSTIHTDSVLNIPDRLLNMMPNREDAEGLINDVYRYVEVGILVRIKEKDGKRYRLVDQVCVFDRDADNKNTVTLLVVDGQLKRKELPKNLIHKLQANSVNDPWYCEEVEQQIGGIV